MTENVNKLQIWHILRAFCSLFEVNYSILHYQCSLIYIISKWVYKMFAFVSNDECLTTDIYAPEEVSSAAYSNRTVRPSVRSFVCSLRPSRFSCQRDFSVITERISMKLHGNIQYNE